MIRLPEDKIRLMDDLGTRGIPFLFVISFDGVEVNVWRSEEIPPGVRFSVPALRDTKETRVPYRGDIPFAIYPVTYERYTTAFEKVMHHIRRGDTYLINLTMPTAIDIPLSLEQIYESSSAPYKILLNDRFVCFSPEIFVRITDGIISSYPMKGTIDASVPGAEKRILEDAKELAEHNTIIDLIRNDLSMVAERVRVKRYRYIDRIETNRGPLLQVSSEIEGVMVKDGSRKIGTLMSRILPAGSISGAPKEKTVEIIVQAEGYDRGFYTGVFGWFDGRNLDSCVMIRFIEKSGAELTYKSGGGITFMSSARSEYEELIKKVYGPFAGIHQD
jgi:para-aminobenzoate synthetase component 1